MIYGRRLITSQSCKNSGPVCICEIIGSEAGEPLINVYPMKSKEKWVDQALFARI